MSIRISRLPRILIAGVLVFVSCRTQTRQTDNETGTDKSSVSENSKSKNQIGEQPKSRATKSIIHIGNLARGGKLVHYVKPVYPRPLRSSGVRGVVCLKVLVGIDGLPQKITYVSGPSELVPYAEDAVRRWRYDPLVIYGTPVSSVIQVDLDFTLSQ